MTTYRKLVFLAIAAAFMAPTPARPAGSGVTVSYTLVKTDLTANEPVYLKVVVNNEMAEGLVVDLTFNGSGYGGFRGKIARPEGQVEEVPKPRPVEGASLDIAHVPPSGSHTKLLLLNAWTEFDEPGRYFIDIETSRPLLSESGIELGYSTGGQVIVDIGPRDPARLRQICADLGSRAMKSKSFSGTAEPAMALSRIRDPIAVPYLGELLLAKEIALGPEMIEGLEGIADEPAVDALISYVNSAKPDPDLRTVALGALTRIGSRTSDPAVQFKIRPLLR